MVRGLDTVSSQHGLATGRLARTNLAPWSKSHVTGQSFGRSYIEVR